MEWFARDMKMSIEFWVHDPTTDRDTPFTTYQRLQQVRAISVVTLQVLIIVRAKVMSVLRLVLLKDSVSFDRFTYEVFV